VSLSITFANSSTRGNSFKLVKPRCQTNILMFGDIFSCRIVDVWKSLSDAVVKSTSVAIFKNSLSTVDLSRFLMVV